MSSMANPINALQSLQQALNDRIELNLIDIGSTYKTRYDESDIGHRYIFAKIVDGEAQALAIFGLEDPIGEIKCYSVGYAVSEKYRRRGYAAEAINKGIEELRTQFRKTALTKFYVEAVIDVANDPSIKFAEKFFSSHGVAIVDGESGTPSLHFKKLIELGNFRLV